MDRSHIYFLTPCINKLYRPGIHTLLGFACEHTTFYCLRSQEFACTGLQSWQSSDLGRPISYLLILNLGSPVPGGVFPKEHSVTSDHQQQILQLVLINVGHLIASCHVFIGLPLLLYPPSVSPLHCCTNVSCWWWNKTWPMNRLRLLCTLM